MKKTYTVNGLTITCETVEKEYTTCENIEQVIYLDREAIEEKHTGIERIITVYEGKEILFQQTFKTREKANEAFKMCIMHAMI